MNVIVDRAGCATEVPRAAAAGAQAGRVRIRLAHPLRGARPSAAPFCGSVLPARLAGVTSGVPDHGRYGSGRAGIGLPEPVDMAIRYILIRGRLCSLGISDTVIVPRDHCATRALSYRPLTMVERSQGMPEEQ